jgi:hypothetical protein
MNCSAPALIRGGSLIGVGCSMLISQFFWRAWMSTLNDKELGGLDSVIAARKMTSDLSDKYENIVIPINNNASIAHTGDNTGLKGGEGLSVDNLMRLRQNSFEQP